LKRTWNYSQAKYSTFWDAEMVLKKLSAEPLKWTSIEEVRNRLVIVSRLLNLFRSVDLARTYRCQSQVGNTVFVLTQRKNQKKPQWEALIKVPGSPSICPVTLMNKYVAMTASHVPSGSLLLRQLKPPYAPLSNNTVGSITKKVLSKFGIDTSFWGPHSTRGAGVQLYKKLGLNSEEVCEVGKWKNVNAFTAHYSRLGASNKASQKINHLVHTVSPICSAESDWSSTPRRKDMGGMDQEDEAQGIGEPTLPTLLPFIPFGQSNVELTQLTGEVPPGESIHCDMVSLAFDQDGPNSAAFMPSFASHDVASSSSAIVPKSPLRRRVVPKRPREAGRNSPPKKFQWANKGKEKQD
jgi:hypothetical protein